MNRTHPRYVVLAALLAFLGAGLYSETGHCCDADGVGTAKAVATPLPVTVTPAAPVARPEAASAQPAVIAGSSASNDDAGNNLGDSPVGTHKRGLRWQSFLPGVIK